eukprot:68759_1
MSSSHAHCLQQATDVVHGYVHQYQRQSSGINIGFSIQIIFNFYGEYGLIFHDLKISQIVKDPNDYQLLTDKLTLFIALSHSNLKRLNDSPFGMARSLAMFTHNVLQNPSRIIVSTDAIMQPIAILYHHMQNSDVFEHHYQKHLGDRLLNGRYTNEETERKMIDTLQLNTASQLHDMLIDMERSRQNMREYNARFGSYLPFDLNVIRCRTGTWPSSAINNINAPDLHDAVTIYEEFCRDLTGQCNRVPFQMSQGNADICIQFSSTTSKVLNVSTYQMVILLLFNRKNTWTFDEIATETKIPQHDLINAILSMVHPKVKVLRKTPKSKKVEKHHTFEINIKYVNKWKKIMVPTLNISVDESELQREHSVILRKRRRMIDNEILRFIKTRRTPLHFNELVLAVSNNLKKTFMANPSDVAKRINVLIGSVILKRDLTNTQLITYERL